MRIALIICGAAAALLCDISASQAYSDFYRRFPWCAVQELGHGFVSRTCVYQTFEQCRPEVIAGNRGTCEPNNYYWAYRHAQQNVAEQPVKRKRRAH